MTTMLEKMARAIYAEFENRPKYAQAQMNGVLAEELARAALLAVREADEGMVGAAYDVGMPDRPDLIGKAWTAMIDAILEGGE